MSNPQKKTLPMVDVPEKGFSSFLNVPVDTNLERLQADVASEKSYSLCKFICRQATTEPFLIV